MWFFLDAAARRAGRLSPTNQEGEDFSAVALKMILQMRSADVLLQGCMISYG